MAEIRVEHQEGKSPWRWLWLLLLVAVLAAAGWYFLMGPGRSMIGGDAGYEVEEVEEVGEVGGAERP